eukprot:359540-Chlamydomonas_euryale.AAC.12
MVGAKLLAHWLSNGVWTRGCWTCGHAAAGRASAPGAPARRCRHRSTPTGTGITKTAATRWPGGATTCRGPQPEGWAARPEDCAS